MINEQLTGNEMEKCWCNLILIAALKDCEKQHIISSGYIRLRTITAHVNMLGGDLSIIIHETILNNFKLNIILSYDKPTQYKGIVLLSLHSLRQVSTRWRET
jgi:hypothetical protein